MTEVEAVMTPYSHEGEEVVMPHLHGTGEGQLSAVLEAKRDSRATRTEDELEHAELAKRMRAL